MEYPSLAERIEGFRRFFAMANEGGPLVGFFLDSYYPLKRYRTEGFLPHGPLSADDLPVEPFLPEYERLRQTYEDYGGDFIWAGAAFWGVPWVEALAGCGVFADQQTGSTRSLPPDGFRGAEDLPAFDPHSPWARKAREFLHRLREHSAGRYPLGTTLMRGISDLLSALYGGPEFLYRLMDHPAGQRRLVRGLTDLWVAFARDQLAEMPDFHGGVGSYFYSMWLPGRGVWLQDDASALMSPQLYGEFIYPAVVEMAEAFDTTVVHLHPSTYIPVDFLVDSPVTAIELHIDLGGPSAEDLYPYYRKIQSRKPLLIWGDLTGEDLEFIARRLDRRSLALMPVVSSREQAETIWKQFRDGRR
jgi:hypothetical protein